MLLQIPIPRDLDVALPLPDTLLHFILIVSFLLHILFVNLMVGGSILCLFYQYKGFKQPRFDALAKVIAQTVTVNKSLAVVMGVAPLLTINTIYTVYFYTANALTGYFWISIIPWVTLCFLGLYWHKYSWNRMKNKKILHWSILLGVVLSFLFIPLIFLSNINLMLFPEKWTQVSGFFSTLTIGNVLPRYIHFITASIALTGVFLYGYFIPRFHRKRNQLTNFSKPEIKRIFLKIVFTTTMLQLLFGTLVYFTLPNLGINWGLLSFLLPTVAIVIGLCIFLYNILYRKKQIPAYAFKRTLFVLGIVVFCMVFVRDIYRESTLQKHKAKVALHTLESREYMDAEMARISIDNITTKIDQKEQPGEHLFNNNCKICHDWEKTLVGPSLNEALVGYKEDKEALKRWIRKPGRKRLDYPQMAGFPNMKKQELNALITYLLE